DWFLSHRYACYNTYETSDSKYISIGAVENRFWKNLCDYLGVPEYTPLQYDDNRRKEIMVFMITAFRQKTYEEWESELSKLDVCFAKVQTIDEVLADPFFKEREMVLEVCGKDGKATHTIGVPVKLSETPGSVRTPPVQFGENTKAILLEIGYTDEEVMELSKNGVI
ncbi:MAG: CoA transferase, partial [Desulfobacterales bacterium]|nr:CoA transferase [Desulfobacterales bacterium]